MRISKMILAAIAVTSTVGLVSFGTARAQTRPTKIVQELALADYHMFHMNDYVYRYDSRTGRTQRLTVGSGTKGVSYDWTTILDTSAGPAGGNGRYEVGPGTNSTGILVRIDTSTGRTWVAVQTNILNWQEVTAK